MFYRIFDICIVHEACSNGSLLLDGVFLQHSKKFLTPDSMGSVERLEELKVPPGNRLESLSGNRKGQHSIRINEQYRLCFQWGDAGPFEVEITDYH